MALHDLYSKRLSRLLKDTPDVYQYDHIPIGFRHQFVHILQEFVGRGSDTSSSSYRTYARWEAILAREYGRSTLNTQPGPAKKIFHFVLHAPPEELLDLIELACRAFPKKEATLEVNTRFQEAAIGYKFEGGQILRIDSQLVHAEIVKPALALLSEPHLSGAQEEFLNAHAHYRSGNHKECLNDCLKAFESTMKGICARRKWTHDPKATAKTLLDLLFAQNLIPQLMQSHFSGLRSTLEAGVPTVRNKMAGHGQGPTPVPVPASIASYVLHLTATNIVFLAKLDSELP